MIVIRAGMTMTGGPMIRLHRLTPSWGLSPRHGWQMEIVGVSCCNTSTLKETVGFTSVLVRASDTFVYVDDMCQPGSTVLSLSQRPSNSHDAKLMDTSTHSEARK